MITELLNMFNRTHTSTSEQDFKDFKIIINIILTDFGSSMYTYMLMLENTERKNEFYLIKEYRDTIFDVRGKYDNGVIPMDTVIKELSIINHKLSTQVKMLQTIDGRKWEAQIFQSILNDFTNFLFCMKDLSKYNFQQPK